MTPTKPKQQRDDENKNIIDAVCPTCGTANSLLDELKTLRQENAQLAELVHTDTLTGLPNFRYFSESLAQEMERTHRSGQDTSLIMLDLDFFKKVNDTHGHEVGNLALVQTARIMRQAVRLLDSPCRYGGEEFTIILPSTGLKVAKVVAERIRRLIEEASLSLDGDDEDNTENRGNTLKITASLGVDVFTNSDIDTPESFVKRTDGFLYQAKNNGRNQIAYPEPVTRGKSHVNQDEKSALFDLFNDDNVEGNIDNQNDS